MKGEGDRRQHLRLGRREMLGRGRERWRRGEINWEWVRSVWEEGVGGRVGRQHMRLGEEGDAGKGGGDDQGGGGEISIGVGAGGGVWGSWHQRLGRTENQGRGRRGGRKSYPVGGQMWSTTITAGGEAENSDEARGRWVKNREKVVKRLFFFTAQVNKVCFRLSFVLLMLFCCVPNAFHGNFPALLHKKLSSVTVYY